MTGNTHVPDKLHAFTLQVRHMMCELISVDSDKIVSVEALDDVAVESASGIVAEQIKSVQSSNNPISDRAEVFWKALYNWLQYIQNGSLELEKTTFRFVIISNHMLNPGSLPALFNQANSIEEARNAIQKAKTTLWGSKNELKNDVPDSYGKYLDVLFKQENSSVVEKIILAMKIEIYASDYDEQLYKKFCGQTIPLEYADILFLFMLGWVHEKVNEHTKEGAPAYILCKDFRDALVAQTRRYNQNETLAWATTRPSDDEAQYELNRQDTYMKQLDLIHLHISDKLQAASCYLRTSSEKTKWAERGIIAPQSFDDYYESLTNMWRNQSRIITLSPSADVTLDGQRIYFTCQDAARNIKMQGMDTPEAFGSGSLHALANAPEHEPKVGWHPAYKDLLKAGVDTYE